MDQNVALHEAREAASEILAAEAPHSESDEMKLARLEELEARAVKLAEAFEALDGWMSKGSALPDAWREMRDHR